MVDLGSGCAGSLDELPLERVRVLQDVVLGLHQVLARTVKIMIAGADGGSFVRQSVEYRLARGTPGALKREQIAAQPRVAQRSAVPNDEGCNSATHQRQVS